MPHLYLPGQLYAAVPIENRRRPRGAFTHILCDDEFFQNFERRAVIYGPGRDWEKLSRVYKSPSNGPLHVMQNNAEVECYVDGHITAFLTIEGITSVVVDDEARRGIVDERVGWEDGTLNDISISRIVATTSEIELVKKKSSLLGNWAPGTSRRKWRLSA